jgi:hypothetical protein
MLSGNGLTIGVQVSPASADAALKTTWRQRNAIRDEQPDFRREGIFIMFEGTLLKHGSPRDRDVVR